MHALRSGFVSSFVLLIGIGCGSSDSGGSTGTPGSTGGSSGSSGTGGLGVVGGSGGVIVGATGGNSATGGTGNTAGTGGISPGSGGSPSTGGAISTGGTPGGTGGTITSTGGTSPGTGGTSGGTGGQTGGTGGSSTGPAFGGCFDRNQFDTCDAFCKSIGQKCVQAGCITMTWLSWSFGDQALCATADSIADQSQGVCSGTLPMDTTSHALFNCCCQ